MPKKSLSKMTVDEMREALKFNARVFKVIARTAKHVAWIQRVTMDVENGHTSIEYLEKVMDRIEYATSPIPKKESERQ